MPPLDTMVVPSPIISEKRISQVFKDILPRPVPPQLGQCEEHKENILEGHRFGQERTLVGLLVLGYTTLPLDGQEVRIWGPPQRFPDLPGASNPAEVAETLLHHLCHPKPTPPPLLRIAHYENHTPLTSEEIYGALSKLSNTCAPGCDHIPYSVWKFVHHLKPSLLPSLLDPLLAHRLHPASLKKALSIALDKTGKSSYDSSSSFRVIVLLRTLSKILETVVASRLCA